MATRERQHRINWHKENYTSTHWRYKVEKPAHWEASKAPNAFCHRMKLMNGELLRCMAETDGRTYCPSCVTELGNHHSGSRFRNIRSSPRYSTI